MKNDIDLISNKIKEFLGELHCWVKPSISREQHLDDDDGLRWYQIKFTIKDGDGKKEIRGKSYVVIDDNMNMILNHEDMECNCIDIEFNAINFLREFAEFAVTEIILDDIYR